MQRALDVFFSGLALIFLAPFLLPIAVILRFTGEGEIFYRQQRVGLGGEHFGLLKFATMLKNSPSIGSGTITVKGDPRILPFGHFLRKTKINELPQILNIFLGDMSVVGPRPMVPGTFEKYGESRHEIAKIRPGLTGVGSIIFRDEEDFLAAQDDAQAVYFDEIVPYKVKLELWYLEHASLVLYIKLIVLTAWVVLFPGSTLHKRWLSGIPPMPPSLAALAES